MMPPNYIEAEIAKRSTRSSICTGTSKNSSIHIRNSILVRLQKPPSTTNVRHFRSQVLPSSGRPEVRFLERPIELRLLPNRRRYSALTNRRRLRRSRAVILSGVDRETDRRSRRICGCLLGGLLGSCRQLGPNPPKLFLRLKDFEQPSPARVSQPNSVGNQCLFCD